MFCSSATVEEIWVYKIHVEILTLNAFPFYSRDIQIIPKQSEKKNVGVLVCNPFFFLFLQIGLLLIELLRTCMLVKSMNLLNL